MRRTASAALLAAALSTLSVSGIAALGFGWGTPQYPGEPTRAHVDLGTVGVLARPRDELAPAASLAETARAAFGEVDALVEVRAEPLPWGEGALITARAVRWR
jgi:hypothetical protein